MMVHPMVARSPKGTKLFFNLDGAVGVKAPNHEADVQLVQFAYYAMSELREGSAAELAAFSRVQPGMFYAGTETDPLTLAIREHQRARGGTQDGHVSVIPAGNTLLYDGMHSFMLVALNNNLRKLMPTDFPRIDKHTRCPAALRSAIQQSMQP
jgi:hypothetical protein